MVTSKTKKKTDNGKSQQSVDNSLQLENLRKLQLENDINHQILNAISSRSRVWERRERGLDPRRDIDEECGFPKTEELDVAQYKDLYDREPVAARVVEILPLETWKVTPEVYEDEPTASNPFNKSWDDLNRQLLSTSNIGLEGKRSSWFEPDKDDGHALWRILKKVDIMSGIGHYGGIFLGLSDVQGPEDLLKPVEPSPNNNLLFMKVLGESDIEIDAWNTDDTDPRFGQPEVYSIEFDNTRERTAGTVTRHTKKFKIHWTRLVHIAEDTGTNEAIAIPRMRPVINNILSLRKVVPGDAEMYWQNAAPGLSFETLPQLGADVTFDVAAMREQLEKYMNRLQRYLFNPGTTAKSLAPNISDPTTHFDVQIDSVCIKIATPKRIFLGSERGELASTQDRKTWIERIQGRRVEHATPNLIVKTLDRLIWIGVLEEPSTGYVCKWPQPELLDDLEKSQVASNATKSLAMYTQADLQTLVSPADAISRILDVSLEEAEEMIARAEEFVDDLGDDRIGEIGRMVDEELSKRFIPQQLEGEEDD